MLLLAERRDDIRTVQLDAATLNKANFTSAKRLLRELLYTETALIVDLSRLEAVDVVGLGLLLRWTQAAKAHAIDLSFCGLTKPFRVMFEVLNLHTAVLVYNTMEEAIYAVKRRRQSQLEPVSTGDRSGSDRTA